MYLPCLTELDAAAATVYAAMPPTPQYCWPLLNEALGVQAWVKHENHTPTGSFKARSALVYMAARMRQHPETRGVIAATRGNHGQSVAFAASRHDLPSTMVVPHGNSVEKNAAMRAFGAQLVVHGADFQEAREHALMLAERDGLHMVPSNHPELIAGVASYWLELLRARPEIELLLVPIGQGSGLCGAIAARHALGHKARIIGVVSSHAPAYQLSWRARRSIEAPVSTVLADGIACRVPELSSLASAIECADDILAVTDDEVARAMRLLYRCTHNLAEGAGAAALAAAMQMKENGSLNQRSLGLPLTGGNVDAALFREVLLGA